MGHPLIINGALHLYGTVGGDVSWDEDGIKATGFTSGQVIEALSELKGDFDVRLNSPGGLAFEGIAIYNALKDHQGQITVYVDALAASAASVIVMAGDRIVMRAGSLMMIHNPASVSVGAAEDHRRTANALDEIASAAAAIYARRSKRSERDVLRMMAEETWMRGTTAQQLGFADAADDEGVRMAVPAFKYSLFKHAPAELLNPNSLPSGGDPVIPAMPDIQKEIVMTTQISVQDATSEIFTRCRSARLSMDDTEIIIRDAAGNVDKARDLIINMMADRAGPEIISHLPNDNLHRAGLRSQSDKQMADALLARLGGQPDTMDGNQFINRPVLEIARAFYADRGVSTRDIGDVALAEMLTGGRTPIGVRGARMFGGMHTASDFPGLLGNALHRFVLDRFNTSPTPLKALSTKRNLSDFRKHTFIRPGESPELEEVVDGGEVKYGTLDEEANGLTLKTYAKLFAISRQAFVNDDLSALSSAAAVFADGGRKKENRLFFEVLSANSFGGALMDDGVPMFHASHGNLASAGAAISEATVSAGREAMRLQADVNGTGNAGVVPTVLLVGPKLETAAEKFVAAISAAKSADANPFAGKLRVEVENQYSGLGWWLFADAQQRAAIQHGYLNGVEGPNLEQREGWTTLGMEYRCVLDFACAPHDHRAAYFNPGATP